MKEKAKHKKSMFAAIILTQFICVLIIIAGVLAVKYTSRKTYKELSKFFADKMCDDTNVSDILSLTKNEI